MEPIGRRSLIMGTAAAVAALRLRNAGLPALLGAQARALVDDPFTLGVATGDPTADGFVAWTRLAPDPVGGGGVGPDPVTVGWEVASDAGFAQVVRSGAVVATADLAHTVHVVVDGLEPDGEWWVRFTAETFTSPVGRGRTLPAGGTPALRFALASCQSYTSGYYTALRSLAGEGCDLWLHLGDYIYENGGSGPVRAHTPGECFTLAEYRNRYAQYKTDPDLQAAHASAPVIPVWDDHEVDNNYAGDWGADGQTAAQVRARRTAGYRAWFEHQPVRLTAPTGPGLEIYRSFSWGDLATFHMLDGRQYRDPAPCGGELADCPERTAVDRSMLGAEQRSWLTSGLGRSTAVWDVVGQQTVFTPLPFGPYFNTDQWDGYPQDRQRVWEVLRQRPNPVVCTGDIHAAGVARMHHDLDDVATERIGTELVGTSISSAFTDAALTDVAETLARGLPYVEYVNARQRGYTVVDLTADALHAEFKVVSDATVPDGTVSVDHVVDVAARVVVVPPDQTGTAPPAQPVTADARFTG
ncbi:MAG TPA: alkaline phosphatase D family protein [Acidimicrobiales bacterium]|nr:alkaline phosphatase D family protein [Acidimicrobiales bacterium]